MKEQRLANERRRSERRFLGQVGRWATALNSSASASPRLTGPSARPPISAAKRKAR